MRSAGARSSQGIRSQDAKSGSSRCHGPELMTDHHSSWPCALLQISHLVIGYRIWVSGSPQENRNPDIRGNGNQANGATLCTHDLGQWDSGWSMSDPNASITLMILSASQLSCLYSLPGKASYTDAVVRSLFETNTGDSKKPFIGSGYSDTSTFAWVQSNARTFIT